MKEVIAALKAERKAAAARLKKVEALLAKAGAGATKRKVGRKAKTEKSSTATKSKPGPKPKKAGKEVTPASINKELDDLDAKRKKRAALLAKKDEE